MAAIKDAMSAYQANPTAAHEAFAIYRGYCNGHVPARVPGMDTAIRLAYRISLGRTAAQAAAREYVYRWHLAIKAPDQCDGSCVSVFGAPHTLGM